MVFFSQAGPGVLKTQGPLDDILTSSGTLKFNSGTTT